MKRATTAGSLLQWRCRAARRAELLIEEQCAELVARLEAGDLDDVRDILDGLGVPNAPDEPAGAGAESWTCPSCQSVQRTRGWQCPFSHKYCRTCMVKHVEGAAQPLCPHEGCGYRLGEHDLEVLRVSEDRLKAFSESQASAGAAIPCGGDSQVSVFQCRGKGCGRTVALAAGEARRRWACSCGAAPVCTGCGTDPYHYHALCGDVQLLRRRWLQWVQGGREAYHSLERRAQREATAQQRALREAMKRHAELSGSARSGRRRAPPAVARRRAVSGRGVRHLFTQCCLCGKCIVGPRFRCIHCPSFSSCSKCEPKLQLQHDHEHVFQIMFEDEINWKAMNVTLPKGIRARIRTRPESSEKALAVAGGGQKRRWHKHAGVEGVVLGQKRGKYVLELPDGAGARHVALEHLQPLLTQKQAERIINKASASGTAPSSAAASGSGAAATSKST